MKMYSPFTLIPYQKILIGKLRRPEISLLALSISRGNGKSSLAALLLLWCLTPGSFLFSAGSQNFLVAQSVAQARRTSFGALRGMIESLPNAGEFRISDSTQAARIVHLPTRTSAEVLPASGRASLGLGMNSRLIIGDEPGAWKPQDGELVNQSLLSALGKPGSRMKILYVGTIAPALESSFWPVMVEGGSGPSKFVMKIQGDPQKWDSWPEIRRSNPLMSRFPESRRTLLEERDSSRMDPRKKAAFLSYRLNCPSHDEQSVLISVDDWRKILARIPQSLKGRPVVGLDLGKGRAFSAAVGIWPSGRVEAIATCGGIPSLADRETQDRVSSGCYSRLEDEGRLFVDVGRRIPRPGLLMSAVREWSPLSITCDRFQLDDLKDTNPPCPIVPRVTRWSESTADIWAFREMAMDGDLNIGLSSRSLLQHSISVTVIKNDEGGNCRIVKASKNRNRDDVAAALTLAAGARKRMPVPRRLRSAVVSAA